MLDGFDITCLSGYHTVDGCEIHQLVDGISHCNPIIYIVLLVDI